MPDTPDFPDLPSLIDERSAAFRAAVAGAPGLDVPVPTYPEWTLADLVRHLGEGPTVAAGTGRGGPRRRRGVPAHLLHDNGRLAAQARYRTTEGRSWRNWLSADGARAARLTAPEEDAATASARGTAGELVLALYGRIPLDSLELDGDRRLFDQLVDWDPER